MDCQLHRDISSLIGKSIKEQYIIINNITEKAITNVYTNAEILEYLNSSSLNEKIDKIVYVNLVNSIKSHELVIKLLQSGDDQLISDAMRKCQFFLSDSKYVPEFYIKEIFPKISYTNRNSLLKRVGELSTPEKCVDFYKILEKVYNRKTAEIFLPYCSESFILEKLQLGIALSQRDLLTLYKRDSRKALHYLQEYLNIQNNKDLNVSLSNISQYDEVIRLLMPIYTKEIVELNDVEKKTLNLKLGRRSSKRLIKSVPKSIISSSEYYNENMKKSQLHRYLKPKDFEKFYKGLWPKNKSKFDPALENCPLQENLKYYKSPEKQLKLLTQTYSKLYEKDLLSDLKNISPNIMKLLPTEDRIKYTDMKIKKGDFKHLSAMQWTKFLSTGESISKFKEEIRITSDKDKRIEIIGLMIESCGINKDLKAVLNVLQYVNQRHRNEQTGFREKLLTNLQDCIELSELKEEHWKEFADIVDIISLNEEFHCYYNHKSLFAKPVEYAIKNNLDIKRHLINYIKWVRKNYAFTIFEKNPEWEKRCLLQTGELLPEIFDDLGSDIILSFYCWICEWNKRHPDDLLSIVDYNYAVDIIEKLFEDEDRNCYAIENLNTKLESDVRAKYIFGHKIKPKFYTHNLKQLLLNKNFALIKENQKEIADSSLNKYQHNAYIEPNILKLFQIAGMKQYFKDYYLEIIRDPKNVLRSKALRLLVKLNLFSQKEFYEFSRQYFPTAKKPRTDKAVEKVFSLQIAIVYCLKKFKVDADALKTAKLFCKGGYLKTAIGTVYSICTKLPKDQIAKFLTESVDSCVSLKKHIIRLQCLIANNRESMDFLRVLWKLEHHPSIRDVLMKLILDEFSNEQGCEFIWECMHSLTAKDKYMLDNLCKQLDKFPISIKSAFLENCWLTVCKIGLEDSEVGEKKLVILTAIDNLIELMDKEFIEKLLNENAFKLNVEYDDNFVNLSVSYILSGFNKVEQIRRLNFIAEIFKSAVKENWYTLKGPIYEDDESFEYPIRGLLTQFCGEYCTKAIKSKYKNMHELLIQLDLHLLELFKDPEVFAYNSYYTIKITIIFLNSNKDFEEFGKQIRDLLSKAYTNNPAIFLTRFFNNLNGFSVANKGKFLNGLLIDPITDECALIAMKLIDKKKLLKEKDCMEKLQNINNRAIKIELNDI